MTSKAENYRQHFLKPLKGGTGIEPRWNVKPYKGIPLTADVRARMAEYAAYPSVQEQTRWIVGGA